MSQPPMPPGPPTAAPASVVAPAGNAAAGGPWRRPRRAGDRRRIDANRRIGLDRRLDAATMDRRSGCPGRSGCPAGWTPPPWTAGPDAFWRRIPAGLLITVALVLAGAVAGWYFDGIEQSGSIAQPATGESDLGELPRDDKLRIDLRVGDCYNLTGDRMEDVKEVPCSTEHELEVIYVGAMGEGSYPTLDGFADYVVEYCDPAFADYIGKSVDDSDLDYDWLVPTQDAWRSGDRTVRCAAYEPGTSLTRSLRGTQQ